MKPEHKPEYTINRTEGFIKKNQELRAVYSRMAELISAIDWALERKPHTFTQIINDYYLLKTGQLSNPDFPQLKILYYINENEKIVVLIDIEDDV